VDALLFQGTTDIVLTAPRRILQRSM